MQINPICIRGHNKNKLAFNGYKKYENEQGEPLHKFFYPFDPNRYKVELEVVPITENKEIGYVRDGNDIYLKTELPSDGKCLEIPEAELFSEAQLIGYRYIVTNKKNGDSSYAYDSGVLSQIRKNNTDNEYTVLFPGRTVVGAPGLTKQILPDIYYPGYVFPKNSSNWTNGAPKANCEIEFDTYVRERALNAVRHQSNILGGTFAGIIKMIPQLKDEGYTRIIGTPFTRDDVSSHLYWTKNAYQVAKRLGTMEDFKTMQIKLFQNGINWIADGAFINEGLDGIHFQDILKYGKYSLFSSWFRMYGLDDDGLKLPIMPKGKAKEHLRFRLVNCPYSLNLNEKNARVIFPKNIGYNPKKETYVQVYDDRLVDESQKKDSNQLITAYTKTNTENPYEIAGQDDVIQLTKVRINPTLFKRNVKIVLKRLEKRKLPERYSFENPETLKDILCFSYCKITEPDKGGFESWNGNTDIAKLNFYFGNMDQEELKPLEGEEQLGKLKKTQSGSFQVQDYTLNAAKFWTKTVNNTYVEYIAGLLSGTNTTPEDYKKKILDEVAKKHLPEKTAEVMTEKAIEYALEGGYRFKHPVDRTIPRDELIIREMYEFPYESLDFGDDILGLLCSPYLTQRARNRRDLTKSKYELWQQEPHKSLPNSHLREAHGVYRHMIEKYCLNYLNDVFKRTNADLPFGKNLFIDDEPTDYFRQVLPLIMPDMMKYLTVKMILPNADIRINPKTGEFDYSKVNMEAYTGMELGFHGVPRFRARSLISRMNTGIIKLSKNTQTKKDLAKALSARINKLDGTSLKMADVIIDRTESGLGWRIDAAKDIATIDALKTRHDDFDRIMTFVTFFWKTFTQTVKKENPHSYITAELTDIDQLMEGNKNKESKLYRNSVDAELKFVTETGINNIANYTHFYSLLKNLISKDMETGSDLDLGRIQSLKNILDGIKHNEGAPPGFLYQLPHEGVINSYTFLSNNDKSRILHTFALDMELFNSDLKPQYHRTIASRVLGKEESTLDCTNLSAQAVAMGDRIQQAFIYSADKNSMHSHLGEIKRAIADLVQGHFKEVQFEPEAFSARPFELALENVIEQAEWKYNLKLSPKKRKELIDDALESILTPAMDRLKTAYKMLVTLPGAPTDFCGDKEGSTGNDTSSGNMYQQERNVIRYEWLGKEYGGDAKTTKPFVKNFYQDMTEIGKLRKRPELSALKDGTTISLPIQQDRNVAGIFRYNDQGSQVICLYALNPYKEEGHIGKDENTSMSLEKVRPLIANSTKLLPKQVKHIEEIILSPKKLENHREGLRSGINKGVKDSNEGVFRNANPADTSLYVIKTNANGLYVLKRVSKNNKTISIELRPGDNNSLVLYRYDKNAKSKDTVITYFNYGNEDDNKEKKRTIKKKVLVKENNTMPQKRGIDLLG